MDSKDVERIVNNWAKDQFGSDSTVNFSSIWKQNDIWEVKGDVLINYFWGLSKKTKNFRVQVDNQGTIVGYQV